jgi:hypothetical protein
MLASVHRVNDGRERDELSMFGAQERLCLEEGNHAIK